MNFAEHPPSKQWAPLSYQGRSFAEVWFKPDDQPWTLTFRIPQQSFHVPGLAPHLTTENLLKAVRLAPTDLAACTYSDETSSGIYASQADVTQPLTPLSPESHYLQLHLQMKPPIAPPVVATEPEEDSPLLSEAAWQKLVTRWNVILGIEVTIDTQRLRMESLRAELEAASHQALSTNDKIHALNADVAPWTKAKSRAKYAVPKVKEFIHRATWSMGTPERKRLEELFKYQTRPEVTVAEMAHVPEEIENLLKDRQILAAQGTTAYQDGKSCCADCQGTLRTLQSNAAANAQKKRVATRSKGKSY